MIFSDRSELVNVVRELKTRAKTVGLAGGVFDILHVGHIRYLAYAKSLCDFLVVAVNSDVSVKMFKGPDRPLTPELERLEIIDSIKYVDACFLFNETNQFENLRLLEPTIFVKGGDYTVDKLVELDGLDKLEVKPIISVFNFVEGKSTSKLIEKIKAK
jgi:rfaE bifunctional protein nucleotidyltransferase chain/domain